jgi:hypothetical protein
MNRSSENLDRIHTAVRLQTQAVYLPVNSDPNSKIEGGYNYP